MNKLLAGLASVLCISGAAQAQSTDWPTQKVVKLIAVFPPGDLLTKLPEFWPQPCKIK